MEFDAELQRALSTVKDVEMRDQTASILRSQRLLDADQVRMLSNDDFRDLGVLMGPRNDLRKALGVLSVPSTVRPNPITAARQGATNPVPAPLGGILEDDLRRVEVRHGTANASFIRRVVAECGRVEVREHGAASTRVLIDLSQSQSQQMSSDAFQLEFGFLGKQNLLSFGVGFSSASASSHSQFSFKGQCDQKNADPTHFIEVIKALRYCHPSVQPHIVQTMGKFLLAPAISDRALQNFMQGAEAITRGAHGLSPLPRGAGQISGDHVPAPQMQLPAVEPTRIAPRT